MEWILKVELYILLCALGYLLVGPAVTCGEAAEKNSDSKLMAPWIGGISIVSLSIFAGWYSIICSRVPPSLDRGNYALRFEAGYENPWTPGLNALANLLHAFTFDSRFLFFTVTLVCVLVTLIALRLSGFASSDTVLLYVCSMCIMQSFYLLKQAPSMAFATLSMVLLFRKRYVASTILLAVSISFHEAAYILIPLFFMIAFAENDFVRRVGFAMILVALLAFSGVSRIAFGFIGRWMPNLMEQAGSYIDESGSMVLSFSPLTAVKGLPYYLILFRAVTRREVLREKIPHYDKYLVMAVFATVSTLLSSYMYWMWRFGAYCYVPLFIFATQLYRVDEERSSGTFWWLLVCSLVFFSLRYLVQIMAGGGF